MDQSPNIPSPFLRFYSMIGFAALAYVVAWALAHRRDHRLAMRLGGRRVCPERRRSLHVLAFQLVFIGWALYCVELIAPPKTELAKRTL